jgi:hypothetical protein
MGRLVYDRETSSGLIPYKRRRHMKKKETETEEVRVIEVTAEDFDDPELREVFNELVRLINKSNERMTRFLTGIDVKGEISPDEMHKLKREQREFEEFTRQINRRLKEYKKNKRIF